MAARLSEDALTQGLAGLPEWKRTEDGLAIGRTFTFKNFNQAFGFMTRVALVAETLNHHPDWSNSYNRVTVQLSTHDAGGLTELDLRLARAMDRIAS